MVADSIAKLDTVRVPTSLGGTLWRLDAYQSTNYTRALPPSGAIYTVAFAGDGQVTVVADCNRGTGTWSSGAKGGLTVSGLVTTLAQCREGSMSPQFLKDLGNVQGYQVVDGRLYLNVANGGGVYLFTPIAKPMELEEPVDIVKGRTGYICTDSTGSTLRVRVHFAGSKAVLRVASDQSTFSATPGRRGEFVSGANRFVARERDADLLWDGRAYQCGAIASQE